MTREPVTSGCTLGWIKGTGCGGQARFQMSISSSALPWLGLRATTTEPNLTPPLVPVRQPGLSFEFVRKQLRGDMKNGIMRIWNDGADAIHKSKIAIVARETMAWISTVRVPCGLPTRQITGGVRVAAAENTKSLLSKQESKISCVRSRSYNQV